MLIKLYYMIKKTVERKDIEMIKIEKGFSLIELMIVIAIIAILSMIAIPSLMKFLAKAKRTEVYVNLGSLAMAQKTYFAENGKYTTNLAGKDSLNWKPEGNFNYTYGFAEGTEGRNFFIGKLKAPIAGLSNSRIGSDEFTICACADIDGDGKLDIISINEKNEIKIIEDDLN